jgi:hypothetical protein
MRRVSREDGSEVRSECRELSVSGVTRWGNEKHSEE